MYFKERANTKNRLDVNDPYCTDYTTIVNIIFKCSLPIENCFKQPGRKLQTRDYFPENHYSNSLTVCESIKFFSEQNDTTK